MSKRSDLQEAIWDFHVSMWELDDAILRADADVSEDEEPNEH
jgi:hypothetical protein